MSAKCVEGFTKPIFWFGNCKSKQNKHITYVKRSFHMKRYGQTCASSTSGGNHDREAVLV